MAAIFAKTKKGQEEITRRGGDLSARVRRVLIIIDGERTVEDLRGLVAADDLTHTLGVLEEEGYIELVAKREASGPTVTLPKTLVMPSLTAFRDLEQTGADSLIKARNFMSNTVNVFVGMVGTSTLIDHIQEAKSHVELRALFDDWYHAIVSSRDGRREAESLREKLLEVI